MSPSLVLRRESKRERERERVGGSGWARLLSSRERAVRLAFPSHHVQRKRMMVVYETAQSFLENST